MKLLLSVVAVLLFTVMASAVGVIYSKHLNRKLFVELQQLNKSIDFLEIEWGRLQLEQSAWSDHGRIEKIAREKLKMALPDINSVVYLQP